ncbi:hypothetical protein EY643_01190 [Halioglobus maricola]|uniref:Uncharacterized protein n=1 Tax=Halioglobus maricola TaxID=2601894 RepID=A0A5P9NGP4_9GAMM|nr:hypothetical protein [Halioglobus maricola]QFU74374.1 hypothetical protein EY643_01190 [Halioglobus maricola]
MTLPRPFAACGFAVLLALSNFDVAAQTHGQVKGAATTPEAWNAMEGQWQPVEAWWLAYASTSEGHFWGKRADYPPYEEVGEHDTLLIVAQDGPCLMYFFHNRWRRAQDVRRWDPVFNQILGCPTVFD